MNIQLFANKTFYRTRSVSQTARSVFWDQPLSKLLQLWAGHAFHQTSTFFVGNLFFTFSWIMKEISLRFLILPFTTGAGSVCKYSKAWDFVRAFQRCKEAYRSMKSWYLCERNGWIICVHWTNKTLRCLCRWYKPAIHIPKQLKLLLTPMNTSSGTWSGKEPSLMMTWR